MFSFGRPARAAAMVVVVFSAMVAVLAAIPSAGSSQSASGAVLAGYWRFSLGADAARCGGSVAIGEAPGRRSLGSPARPQARPLRGAATYPSPVLGS